MNGFDRTPFIKTESDNQDSNFNSMTGFNNYGQSWSGPSNPTDFNFQNSSTNMRTGFSSAQHLSSSFNDDELADFLDYDGGAQVQTPQSQYTPQGNTQTNQASMNGFQSMSAPQRFSHNRGNNDVYSNTPPGNPIQSPFAQSYDRLHMPTMARLQQNQGQYRGVQQGSMSHSPHSNSLQGHSTASTSRSPSGQNAAMANLNFGTSDASSHGGQSIPNPHQRSGSSSQWENRLGGFSFDSDQGLDTPLTSPMSVPPIHQQLASIMENEKSPPSRSKAATVKAQSVPSGSSKEEQKKAKRRNAHNVVEQKRRDKINERIQELSRLVPAHRLEDNKIKKQLASSSRGGASMSPPTASALRKSSAMSQTLAVDDRDKTKGNSLDGAVAWTRDLMWMLHRKLEQESILLETIESLGGQVPFQVRDDELRMRSELMSAINASGADCFEYSRGHGSGLWVPDHTDQAGNPLAPNTAPDYFVEYQPNQGSGQGQQQEAEPSWGYTPESGRDSLDFKEQDEFVMDMS